MPRLFSPDDLMESVEEHFDSPSFWRETSEANNFPDDISEQTLAFDEDGLPPETDVTTAVVQAIQDRESQAPKASSPEIDRAKQRPLVIDLSESTVVNPRSAAANFEPPMSVTRERHARDVLVRLAESVNLNLVGRANGTKQKCSVPDFIYIDLDEFEIYTDTADTRNRLRSLHLLATSTAGVNQMYFDGILSVGTTRLYVQRVPFREAPVDRYGTEFDTVRGHISIRSTMNQGREVYYRLGKPSNIYSRFYKPYLWVADLCKHFIDFVDDAVARDRDVRVSHFRLQFAKWLQKTHAKSPAVASWRAEYGVGRNDFAPAIAAYGKYLLRETADVMEDQVVCRLGIFKEIQSSFYKTHKARIPEGHPVDTNGQPLTPLPTVVTPYMHHMFKDLAIGDYLQSTPGKHAPMAIGGNLVLPQKRMPFITGTSASSSPPLLAHRIKNIQPGDLISTLSDDATTGSKWLASAEKSPYWYALVHRVIEPPPHKRGERSFHVVWLYRPEHTPCGSMKYPWPNELFMCDHCTCDEADDGDDEPFGSIAESEVTGIHSIEWFGGPDTTADFFVRQTYLHGERSWVQLKLGHIFCKNSIAESLRPEGAFASHFGTAQNPVESIGVFENTPDYNVGDTVLVLRSRKSPRSEPYEIVSVPGLDKDFCLRRLLRRNEVDPSARKAPPNELVYTDDIIELSKNARILGRCVVRIFSESTKIIPTPYNRGGVGNMFYMSYRMEKTPKTVGSDIPWHTTSKSSDYDIRFLPLDAAKDAPNLRQGFNPSTPVPRLRAMELFCGCGNLGRGIEDAGATETRCANDIWPVAIHTFMANVASPDRVQPFIGSADTLLERAIRDNPSSLMAAGIPAPGDIDFISGGSPCQGFSSLTMNKATKQQFKNRSMVASFASFVDLYRPKFGILENVPAIVNNGGKTGASTKKDQGRIREDIFGQLICSLLGLGYQLRIMLGNAWIYGVPQRRQRVFLIFAAPGFALPDIPLPSHTTPADLGIGSQRTVGRLATGEWITGAGHEDMVTAFPFVSAGEATADLDKVNITDGIVDICVRQPDHRILPRVTDHLKAKMAAIPTQPYGMGLMQARHLDYFAKLLAASAGGKKPLFNKRELSLPVTRAYMRTNPTRFFQTVRTSCTVADAWSAGVLHWREPRPLSVLEVRRAQGLPDDDVLLGGSKVDQWKMVGNAVARQIALALGLSLREAWLGTLCEDRRPAKATTGAFEEETVEDPVPATTTTTTTTAAMITTVMPTTTTTTTKRAHSAAEAQDTVGEMPIRQNRIFQTSVRRKSTSTSDPKHSAVAAEFVNITGSDGYRTLKRARSESASQSLDTSDEDVVESKHRRRAGNDNVGDRSSNSRISRSVVATDTDEDECFVLVRGDL
ncbi:hypothetical protein SBRCBS47491_009537 [Sporothrix bragantina]|uniref:DNA (cytosine-5-)-methyltransferase n=1 Tax=Sporothrix bragantina TaxID=671064 RepID=A0ABP0CY84_9PEZI